MQMVDEILSDTKMNKLDRIEKLEAVLNTVISSHELSSIDPYNCHCPHQNGNTAKNQVQTADAECQTLSTGDIVVTNIYYDQNNKDKNKTLTTSPKKIWNER